jgi:predicted glycosyltransferase
VLVTTGGGGDGAALVDWVLRAYEYDPTLEIGAKIILGPFMGTTQQALFMERVARLKKVQAITFAANIEPQFENAVGIVAMGGYNTFCEILSFDKRALIVPRTVPRLEQYIRASRAEELGLVRMLVPDDESDPIRMADAIRALPQQPKPSHVHIPGLLDGLSAVNSLVDQYLGNPPARLLESRLSVVRVSY